MAKLTWGEVCLIRLGGVVGMSRRFLGEQFHVDPNHVGQILRGRNWKETPDQQAFLLAMFTQAGHVKGSK